MNARDTKRQQQISNKLAAEGIAISDPWPTIQAVLLQCVAPTALLACARAMHLANKETTA